MKIRRIDRTRWQVGGTRVELAINRGNGFGAFGIGFARSIGGYDGDEKQTYIRAGYLSLWFTKELGRYVGDEQKHGFELTTRIWQRWYGKQTNNSSTEEHVFYMWHDRLKDKLFGRSICATSKGRVQKVMIPMPEGEYEAVMTFKWRIWTRARSPFRKMRLSTDIDIPKGIPFAGKGENSWDCVDDGIYGMGSSGHDIAKAVQAVQDYVFKRREKYGAPSAKAIQDALA